MDGNVRPVCRPQKYQWIVYNEHKRLHGIKFQSAVAPTELMVMLYIVHTKVKNIIAASKLIPISW